jgi:hypothetical protein
MDGEFMRQAIERYKVTKGEDFDRKQHEEAFDSFMNSLFSQTFGNLLKRVPASDHFPDDLNKRLAAAKEIRDFLAHHYWRERSIQFSTESGRGKLIDELDGHAKMFQALDRELDPIGVTLRKANGIDEENFQAWNRGYMDRVKTGEIVE